MFEKFKEYAEVLLVLAIMILAIALPWLCLGPETFWQRLAMGIVSVPWSIIVVVVAAKLYD